MHYIEKKDPPDFFMDDTQGLTKWGEYKGKKKRKLKEFILENEQNHLCVYCEAKVELDNSHIEHLKPKAQDKYPHLIFEFSNLTVSCDGNCFNHPVDTTRYNCGHIKDNEYDEARFLNPTTVTDISDYFQYDSDSYEILPSSKEIPKADYMINTLTLNTPNLTKARQIALSSFQKAIKKYKKKEDQRNKIKEILKNKRNPFISFLKYRYRFLNL